MAQAILASFALAATFWPSIVRSADKKTRSHITAVSGRITPKSGSTEQAVLRAEEIERELEIDRRKQAEVMRLAEERRLVRLEKKLLAEQKADLRRLEKQQRLAEEKMEKRLAEEKRQAEKELAKRLSEEKFRFEKEIEQKLEDKLRDSEIKLKERLVAEEQAKKAELEKKIEEERRLASEALRDQLAKEEDQEVLKIQTRLNEKESISREKLESKLVEDEQRAIKKIEKEIADEARSARKEMAKRLGEWERLAEAELEKQVDQESLLAQKKLGARIKREAETKKARLLTKLEKEEHDALLEVEDRLKGESLLLSERKRVEAEFEARELAEKELGRSGNVFKKKPKQKLSETNVLNRTFKEDEYKRPSLWRSFSLVPQRLLASIGSASSSIKGSYPGYLAYRAPPPLRFSDDSSLTRNFPSSALPEFSMVARGSGSLVVETQLSGDEARKQALLNQIVVELEPHTIVSGKIDTTIPSELEERDRLLIEEAEGPVVRPEEVLIFFENKRDGGNARTIIPFSPAIPSDNSPSKSGATYNRK